MHLMYQKRPNGKYVINTYAHKNHDEKKNYF